MAAYARIDLGELDRLVNGAHYSPHSLLGGHLTAGTVTIRTIQHGADVVNVVIDGTRHRMTHVHRGVWAVGLTADSIPDYLIEATRGGAVHLTDDPYSFLPTLGDIDLHLIGEGRLEDEVIRRIIGSALSTADRYFPAYMRVLFGGDTPEDAVFLAELDLNTQDTESEPASAESPTPPTPKASKRKPRKKRGKPSSSDTPES